MEPRVLLNGTLPGSEHSYEYGWTDALGGSGSDISYDITLDSQGNIFLTGYFHGTVDFDPTAESDSHTSNGSSDVFVTKLNNDGSYAWTVTFGAGDSDCGKAVAVDPDDNVFVTGSFLDTVDFEDGEELISNGNADIFVAKFQPDGTFEWAVSFGSGGWDQGNDIAVDSAGNVLVTGEFTGTIDFNPTGEGGERTSNGSIDIFVTKLDSNGNYSWSHTFGGDDVDRGYAVAVDAANSVYITGRFGLTVDFDPDPIKEKKETSNGGYDVFITKINAFGIYSWTETFGGAGWDESRGLALFQVDDDNCYVYVTGEFSETVDFNPTDDMDSHTSNGFRDIFVTKITGGSHYEWTVTLGGSHSDYGRDLVADAQGNVIVTGDYEGFVDFDPAGGTEDNYTSNGLSDIFITQLTADGSYGWTAAAGGIGNDTGLGVAVGPAPAANIFVTGHFQETVDFDPNDTTDLRTSSGEHDFFVTMLDPNNPPTADSLTAYPDPVARGDLITLSAVNVVDADGDIDSVRFYRDNNNNGQLDLDADVFLGEISGESMAFDWTGTTSNFPLGNNTFFAQVQDDDGALSNIVSVTAWINERPSIAFLSHSPSVVLIGDDLTLTANNVVDTDGVVTSVEFYRDANGNHNLDLDTDDFLGMGIQNVDDFFWIGSTTGFNIGTNYCFARAQDNDLGWSYAASNDVLVYNPPTMDSQLLDAPDPVVNLGENLTITAVNVQDGDGNVPKVEFYRDINGNQTLDVGVDDLLGVDTDGSDGFSWTGPTTGFNIGLNLNHYFARAQDDDNPNAFSNIAATTGRVNDRPSIDLSANPDPVIQGFPLMISAINVSDSDGYIIQVDFYRDDNDNDVLDFDADTLIKQDTDGSDDWFWFGVTSGLPVKTHRYFARALDNDGAFSDVAAVTSTVEHFSITAGLPNSKTVKYMDSDGSEVKLKLERGTATLYFEGDSLSSSVKGSTVTLSDKADLIKVQLLNTDHRSSLSFIVKGGDGQTTLAGLTGGTLNKITGKNVDLIGDIDLTGSLSSLILDDIDPNVSISTQLPSVKGLKVKADQIADGVAFNIADDVKSFQASAFAGGSVTADMIKSVKIKQGPLGADLISQIGPIAKVYAFGNIEGSIDSAGFVKTITSKTGGIGPQTLITAQDGYISAVTASQDIAGGIIAHDFIKKITSKKGDFTGLAQAGLDVAKIQAHNFQNAVIAAAGDLKKIIAKGDIDQSFFMAGYDMSYGTIQGVGDGDVGSITVRGAFSDSFISAAVLPPVPQLMDVLPNVAPPYIGLGYSGNIGKVKFGAIDMNADDDFGLYAADSIKPVKVGNVTFMDSDPLLHFMIEDFLG
ncbi:MAG: hypothetical protein AMJ79_00125 [Phycisphaerae bacterium SM23_30]|nr:MAG: hypothetical protein AMJ79_00125 [Phycisphaerae bacterium SM23_30]